MKKVKITVLKRTLNREMIAKYASEPVTVCPRLEEGQVFYVDCVKPDGFCNEAWKAIYPYVSALSHGGEQALFDWKKTRGMTICNCGDGLRPVIFKLETTEETFSLPEVQADKERLENLLTMQQQMVDAISCGVFAYTVPDRKVLILNDEMRRIYGLEAVSPNDFGEAMTRRVLPEDLKKVQGALESLRLVGDHTRYRFHIHRKNGETAALEGFSSRRSFEDGRHFILSVVQDITEQERLQFSLNREKQLYRYALSRGVDCCFTFDVTSGVLTSPVSIHGVDVLSKLGLSLPVSYDMFSARFFEHYQVQPLRPSMMECYSREGLIRMYERGCFLSEADCYMAVTGIYYRALLALSRDESDGHLYALYFSRDTTELHDQEETRRKELEDAREELSIANQELQEALHSEREKTKVIGAISNGYIAIFHVDLETGAYREVNESNYMKDAYRDAPDARDTFSSLITARVAPSFREKAAEFSRLDTIAERMGGKKTISVEYMTSEEKWVRSSIIEARRKEDGTLTEVLFATERIDEEKRKELIQQQALRDAYDAANRANDAKTNFLASMSHDIRTPMNVIIGMTAIAGTHIDDKDRVADCLSKITTSSKHLLGLINEVLDMNKIESGKLDLCLEDFNLSDLVENLLTMVRPQVQGRKHELIVNIRNVEHEHVVGDSQRIQQVFMNLMSNAVKYTPEGGRIELDISEKPTNHRLIGCYEFVFQDNGIGMSKEFLPVIFEPFSRARDAAVEEMQGTGLGMAITNNIVHMMNGDIQVESTLGEGTRFTVTIYLKLQDVDETVTPESFTDLPVLVVDNDPLACEAACNALNSLGMSGEFVLSGREAVASVALRHQRGEDFFAVIIDWKMPEMDGIATTKAIRKQVEADIPIIILSAYDWSDIEAEARAAGANAFLSKPIFKSRMLRLFRTILEGDSETVPEFDLREFSKKDFSGKRVLLVEDNEVNAEIAGEILSMAGLEVEFAANGKEAVDRISMVEDDYYSIVFMDVQMPVMNGYEATRAIRSMSRPYAKRVPVLAMTANAFAEDVQESKSAGMNEHIAKPLNFEELLKALHHWLD